MFKPYLVYRRALSFLSHSQRTPARSPDLATPAADRTTVERAWVEGRGGRGAVGGKQITVNALIVCYV